MNKDFPFYHEIKVRFRDVDMMRHVNNAVYLTYLEEGRTGFGEWVFKDHPQFGKFSYIVASVSINYRAPALYRDYLRIYLRVKEMRNSSFVFQYEIRKKETDELVADAESVQVMYDYRQGKKYTIPEELREIIRGKAMGGDDS